jgi:GMP synthase (glutamine-hydrolysing)
MKPMTRQVLIIVHQEHSTPGKVGMFLEQRGCRLDRRCPNLGDSLPQDLTAYDAAVVFGGPMSANDDHLDGIRAELGWLERVALPSGIPLLGICLGAQEMARVLGAKVGPRADGLVEIGYTEIHPTAESTGFLERTTTFYQWHSETFEIPKDAVHLAANEAFPGQAFRYGESAFAIEFHPEMTLEMINRWCTSERGSAKLNLEGAQAHEDQVTSYHRHAETTDRWLGDFLDRHLLGAAETLPMREVG